MYTCFLKRKLRQRRVKHTVFLPERIELKCLELGEVKERRRMEIKAIKLDELVSRNIKLTG